MATAFTREQFAWLVAQRATFVSAEAVAQEFASKWKDTTCTLDDVARADRENLPDDWKPFFDAERENFLNAPTANREHRVAELHRMFVKARDRNALDLAAELLEQIAKEQADAYGPKGGKPGAPLPGVDQEPIEEIRVTIVDPKQPDTQAAS